jgi:hypothetical protein
MRFGWKRRRKQARQAVDEVAATATDLAEKTLTIGPGGVLMLLGAAAIGAAATYYVSRRRKSAGKGEPQAAPNKKAAGTPAASSRSGKAG